MPYIINNRSNDTIIIPDGELNQDYSIDLVGRNYENYGSVIAKNLIDLLDNFATESTPPVKAADGQLWYDKLNKRLRVYDISTGSWKPTSILVESQSPLNSYGQNSLGTAYYNTALGQLFIHDGVTYKLASKPGEISDQYSSESELSFPSQYGTTIRNIFLTDTSGVKRTVLAMVYVNDGAFSADPNDEKIIALLSGHAEFTVANESSITNGISVNYHGHLTEVGGIGSTIRPGINLRTDNDSQIERSNHALRADTAFKLNTGSYNNDSANILASDVYHKNSDIISNQHNTHTLGNNTTVFSEAYIKDVFVGEAGTAGSILKNNNSTVNIGAQEAPIDELHVSDIHLAGNMFSAGGDLDLGTSDLTVDSITANVATIAGYTLPTTTGTNGQQIFVDDSHNCYWLDPVSNISEINTGNGLELDTTVNNTNPVTGSTLDIESRTISLTINDSYIRNLFSAGTNLEYDDQTGIFNNTYTTAFDDLNPSSFVQTTGTQSVGGDKTFTSRVTLEDGLLFGASTNEIKFSNNLGFAFGNTNKFLMYTNGNFLATGDITAFSDRKLKTNLEKIDNALDKVCALTGYVYDRIDTGERQSGLIAQDVQEVLPEVVHTNHDDTLGVAYGNMLGLIVEAIKELREEIKTIKKG